MHSKMISFLFFVYFLVLKPFCFSQVPNFGSAANFALFSGSGAVGNTGASKINGDIGTNLGAITGFNNQVLNGSSYVANSITAQATQDLLAAYNQLFNMVATNTTHPPTFGNGEIITSGVYEIASAASMGGNLYLDAAGDASKVFIFKINGAFTSTAASAIYLLNGASACNIFWITEGAIGLGASTQMVGTLLAHNGANSIGANCTLQGRAFSTSGAVAVNTITNSIPSGCTLQLPACSNNPVITSQPNSAKVFTGQSYTTSVAATGADLTYQWRKDGVDIAGATSPSLTILCNTSTVSGQYSVAIVGSCSPYVVSAIDTLTIPPAALVLGKTSKFLIFTISGAIANTGESQLTGNVGTNSGLISGVDTSKLNGSTHNSDSSSNQAVKDLLNLYGQLSITTPTNTTHAAIFGNDETLTSGVYSIATASSAGGNLTLDAAGDSDKVFIFKINGAFTTGAGTRVNLVNDAKSANIYWVVEGAIALAANTTFAGTLIANNAAISMGSNSILDGRLFSTGGAISMNTVTAVKPEDPAPFNKWMGIVNNDWFSIYNWNNGVIPADSTNVIITAGRDFYPVIFSNTIVANNITIEKNASYIINGGNLILKGNIYNNGIFDASAGTISLMGHTVQTLTANTFLNNTIQNLVIGNDVTLTAPLNVTGAISFAANNTTFNTGQFLTLKSSALSTASIGDLTNTGALSGNSVIGNITTELYIPAKRAWRLLSGQVCAPKPLTIYSAWQEGSNTNNPAPGYGTQITGGNLAYGFDAGVNTNTGIKIYNSSTNNFTGLPLNPGTKIPLTNYPGYFLFIRGDRSTNLALGVNAPVTPTILRVMGTMNAGTINQYINAANYTLVGNPYLESIDFHTLTKNNVADKFYLWDPKLAGVNGVGGYVTFIWNNAANAYDATSFVSNVSQHIALGQAFFVESADGINSGSIAIKESDKTKLGSDNVFRTITKNLRIRIDLLEINEDKSISLLDGVLINFDKKFNNAVNKDDAKKIFNLSENICLIRDNIDLAIERRRNIEALDTSFLSLYGLKRKSYQLLIKTESLNDPELTALVKDNYLVAKNNIPVNMDGSTTINFSVNQDTASFATNRFSIVFQKVKISPFQFISFTAVQDKAAILVHWTTANELNIKSFEVQGSADGINFNEWTSVNSFTNSTGNGIYNWENTTLKEGLSYYRIKSISQQGEVTYSQIIAITINKNKVYKSILVIGDPIINNKFKLQFNNIERGVYKLGIFTMGGQLTKLFSINYLGENSIEEYEIGKLLADGKYQLVLFNKKLRISTSLIKAK